MENGANCSLHGMTVGCVLCTTRSEGTIGQGNWVPGTILSLIYQHIQMTRVRKADIKYQERASPTVMVLGYGKT